MIRYESPESMLMNRLRTVDRMFEPAMSVIGAAPFGDSGCGMVPDVSVGDVTHVTGVTDVAIEHRILEGAFGANAQIARFRAAQYGSRKRNLNSYATLRRALDFRGSCGTS